MWASHSFGLIKKSRENRGNWGSSGKWFWSERIGVEANVDIG